jgi:hypothetical protein
VHDVRGRGGRPAPAAPPRGGGAAAGRARHRGRRQRATTQICPITGRVGCCRKRLHCEEDLDGIAHGARPARGRAMMRQGLLSDDPDLDALSPPGAVLGAAVVSGFTVEEEDLDDEVLSGYAAIMAMQNPAAAALCAADDGDGSSIISKVGEEGLPEEEVLSLAADKNNDARHAFLACDVDGDGTVTPYELHAVLCALGCKRLAAAKVSEMVARAEHSYAAAEAEAAEARLHDGLCPRHSFAREFYLPRLQKKVHA